MNRSAAKLMAEIIWRRLDVPGFEHFRLWQTTSGPRLTGTVIAVEDGTPMRLEYEICTADSWETLSVTGTLDSADTTRALNLFADERRCWRIDGRELPDLSKCVDTDLSLSPATNLLPIRRLGLLNVPIGEPLEVTAAWVVFPLMTVEPLPQRYTRIADRRFRYESLGFDFTTEIEVDALGLVVSYPPLWERVLKIHGRPA
jgi:hypothetical protein